MAVADAAFVGSIPEVYERLLVPLMFAEPARQLAAAALSGDPADILETAAGTGVLARALVAGGDADIIATDLNQPMLDAAATRCASPRVRWQVADALNLPMPDGSFDAVACQFGAMFFPDKSRGYAEALRVLRPGGVFWFTVWDRLAANPAWQVVSDALNAASPGVPIEFLRRTPYAYFDADVIRGHLVDAGFDAITIDTLAGASQSTAANAVAGICQGTPLRGELEAHPALSLDEATSIATTALIGAFGDGAFGVPISWLQVSARRTRPSAGAGRRTPRDQQP